jgi:hypothetical protein
MTEQSAVTQSISRNERSKESISCRASYECLMSATKSFVLNFNNLSNEEKAEFKSLVNYVKQLHRCIEIIKSINSGSVNVVRKSVKKTSDQSQEVEVKQNKSKKGKKNKEVSPTLNVINPVEDIIQDTVPIEIESTVSKAVSKDLKSSKKSTVSVKKSA